MANGLRNRVDGYVQRGSQPASGIAERFSKVHDAQSILVFIWDYWNDIFRHDFSFVERSLVSEIREFRNRWAHQEELSEADLYRMLDSIQRLLKAFEAPEAEKVDVLRRESLRRLYESDAEERRERVGRQVFAVVTCVACAIAVDVTAIQYLNSPMSWIIAGLVTIAFTRLAFVLTARAKTVTAGPRECSDCGKIIYTTPCPYCRPRQVEEPVRPTATVA